MHTDLLSPFSLADADDDVRSVSATCLLPILPLLAESLGTDDLAGLLDTLWNCFSVDGDDLGSSTSAVMDLLCEIAILYSSGSSARLIIDSLNNRSDSWFSQGGQDVFAGARSRVSLAVRNLESTGS